MTAEPSPESLPELPEPFGFAEPTERSPAFHFMRRQNESGLGMFTADQMRAYGAECWRLGALAERANAEQAAKRYRWLKSEIARRTADGCRVSLDWLYCSDTDAVIDARIAAAIRKEPT
jgi:hypothetical protein